MKVYLVEDNHNCPGRILGVFRHKEDAETFADTLDDEALVEERTLLVGQPENRGFNR